MAEEEKQKVQKEAEVAEEVSLLDDIVQATKLKPSDEAYAVTRQGVQAFIDQLLKPGREAVKVSAVLVDEMIAEIDQKISGQTDAVMHHEDFQKLESGWRSLKFLIDRTDTARPIPLNTASLEASPTA
jgi:type VI secretion system protein ImpC